MVLGFSLRTLIAMAVGLSIAIGMYYDLRGEVELAKELPPPQVTLHE